MTRLTARRAALVTGASEGIGRALARELAAAGYAVTGVARDGERLRVLTESLGEGHTAFAADLATEDGVGRVARTVRRTPFDVLVNNAGAATAGPFAAVPLEHARAMVNLNCHALVTLAHAFLEGARPGPATAIIAALTDSELPQVEKYVRSAPTASAMSSSACAR